MEVNEKKKGHRPAPGHILNTAVEIDGQSGSSLVNIHSFGLALCRPDHLRTGSARRAYAKRRRICFVHRCCEREERRRLHDTGFYFAPALNSGVVLSFPRCYSRRHSSALAGFFSLLCHFPSRYRQQQPSVRQASHRHSH